MAAQTYGLLGDPVEMEKALKKTVEANPHSLEAYTLLAGMYYKQGRLDYARSRARKIRHRGARVGSRQYDARHHP